MEITRKSELDGSNPTAGISTELKKESYFKTRYFNEFISHRYSVNTS
jgi:hypothetical protein